ncbi:DNA adenine methylase [Nocardia otitidiscaviarum]|uniref:DNA adenine methylase n=1 Tax=Nocardia otitidiscaviarum TaxID=1823 RepID=UPI0007C7969C|nr:DNA adenine methylase [Nocardia otitidiscaviarum]
MKPPMAYYGGKTTLAAKIAGMLPEHGHYVEPFAGSLAVLLAKPAARMETVNDIDGDLMTFWRVLRDRSTELARVCALTPHSRAEHEASHRDLSGLDELERARRVWVRITQGRTGTLRRTGWRYYIDPAGSSVSMPRYLAGYLERMLPAAERLAAVSLESRPALELIAAYGRHRSALLYVDPPYLGSTRGRNYRHEMGADADHRALAAALHACQATVVLSGYASDLYDRELFPHWYRYELAAFTTQGGSRHERTEVLWSNHPLQAAPEEGMLPLAEFRNSVPIGEDTCDETLCAAPGCPKVRTPAATGRPGRYCSTACRMRASRERARSRELSAS